MKNAMVFEYDVKFKTTGQVSTLKFHGDPASILSSLSMGTHIEVLGHRPASTSRAPYMESPETQQGDPSWTPPILS